MKNIVLITTFLLALIGCAKSEWGVAEIAHEYKTLPIYPEPYPVSSTIKFNNGVELKTNIIDIEVIDVILSEEGVPFVIFSGVDCFDCDVNTAIYIHSPNAGFLDGSAGKNSYFYPGKLNFYIDNSLLMENRLFYGNCLSEDKKNVVWYTNFFGEDEKWHKVVYVVEFVGNNRQESEEVLDYSNIVKTLAFVESGVCKEVPGVSMTSEP